MKPRVLVILLFVAGAALVPRSAAAAVILRSKPFLGVTHHRIIERLDDATAGGFALPREVVADVLVIDPTAPGIDFTLQPDNGEKPGEVTRITTRALVDALGAQIGVNGDFYDTKPPYEHEPPDFFTDVIHLNVAEGRPYSHNYAPGRPVFNLDEDNRGRVLIAGAAGTHNTVEDVSLFNAIGGNQRLVADGKNVTPDDQYANALNPHTALGVTYGGKILIMTVDGRQDSYSRGLRTGEMADLLIGHFDAKDVLNLDGGGSTTLVFDDTDDGVRNARIINSPSDGATAQTPGTERLVANSLVVFAKPNPEYTPLPPAVRPAPPKPQPLLTERTVFETFEKDLGRFADPPATSGSGRGVADTSTSQRDPRHAASGLFAMRLDLRHNGRTDTGLQVRLLSGGAEPRNNLHQGDKAMGATGAVSVDLRMAPGAKALFLALLVDDGTLSGTRLERSTFRAVVADGRWHTYTWSLNNPDHWHGFAGGNGVIDGPNVFLDSLYFSSTPETRGGPAWEGSVWVDQVRFEPAATHNH
ncbi:MAG: phosphodiester glycosidase family protein [Planctomycetota bacterium]